MEYRHSETGPLLYPQGMYDHVWNAYLVLFISAGTSRQQYSGHTSVNVPTRRMQRGIIVLKGNENRIQ